MRISDWSSDVCSSDLAAAASAPAAAASAPASAVASAAGASVVVVSSAAFSPQAARANMLAATAIAANFFMMCGLPNMPFRAGETFLRRERRDLVLPRESSTKIIAMVQCDRNRTFGPHHRRKSEAEGKEGA